MAASADTDARSLLRHTLFGLVSVVCLFGGLLGWASVTQISGAIIGQGTFVVQGFPKLIQHQEGGVIKDILVQDEDHVAAGEIVTVLDDTAIAASLAIYETQLIEGLAREVRLIAEIEDAPTFVPSEELAEFDADRVDRQMGMENRILQTRRATRSGRIAQLHEQIVQIERQIEGMAIQQMATERQLEIIDAEVVGLADLLEDSLVPVSRMNTLLREKAEAEGTRGGYLASISQARASIAERRLQFAQINDEFLTTALGDLSETRRATSQARQQRRIEINRLQRTIIRAPQAGVVHESILHTIGGIAPAGETLMVIVPQDEDLVAEIRISPIDIDKIHVGQPASLRLSSFDQRSTPELSAHIRAISPDLSHDPSTGTSFYTARVDVSEEELNKLPPDLRILPGMPLEAFVRTGDRTVLSYLIAPFTASLARALRED